MSLWRLCVAALGLACTLAWGQAGVTELKEQVIMVPKKSSLFSIELETTLYKPEGEGPFPVAVINHGRAYGDARFQERYRPTAAARFFLQRGYAVVVPMRQGFSKSGGAYVGGGCNIESNGLVQAEDVKAVLDYVTLQSWADKSRILMVGQSHGGWTTLAFGTFDYPGVRGLVNFAGGLRQDSCAGWEATLARTGTVYGRQTRLPSLWFYGDNDSYFAPHVFRPLHENYVAAGGKAELIAFGKFGNDAHSMFASRSGAPIWQPRVERFMQSLGMPVGVLYPEFGLKPGMPTPPATNFAALAEVDAVPYLKVTGRAGYQEFLTKQFPRAFAISPSGAWGWADMGDDPLERALASCNKHTKNQPCRLYAVDDQVVWVKE